MNVTMLPDGTEVREFKPLQGVPFYRHWLNFLLAHGAAFEVTEVDKRPGSKTFGQHVTSIKPTDRHQEQLSILWPTDNGFESKVICIRCGCPVQGLRTERIRIGAYVQFPEAIEVAPKLIERKFKRKPVSKSGLGCPLCTAELLHIVASMFGEQADKTVALKDAMEFKLAKDRILAMQFSHIVQGKGTNCLHGIDGRMCAICLRHKPALPTTPDLELRIDALQKETAARAFIDVSMDLVDTPRESA